MFFEQGRPHSAVVGGTLLREKHLCIVIEELKASNGWITSFKQRHGVVYKTVFGECRSVVFIDGRYRERTVAQSYIWL
jgi:hypothetical protein